MTAEPEMPVDKGCHASARVCVCVCTLVLVGRWVVVRVGNKVEEEETLNVWKNCVAWVVKTGFKTVGWPVKAGGP